MRPEPRTQNSRKLVRFAIRGLPGPCGVAGGDLRHNGGVTTPNGTRFTLAALAATAAMLLGAGPAAAAFHTPVRGIAIEEDTYARVAPDPGSRSLTAIYSLTPIKAQKTVIPVIEIRRKPSGEWAKIELQMRPNGRFGWIPLSAGRLVRLEWSIRVDVTHRMMFVSKRRKLIRKLRVIVGADRTPTPLGNFFVVEKVRLGTKWSPRGWALALSAFSEILRHYDGGEGQVAIHARGTLSGDIGTASSHGCIRVQDRDAAWLASRIPNGTPVNTFR